MRLHTFIALALLASGTVVAQELTLFEQIDAEAAPEQPAQAMPMGMQQQNGQPAFTLRGTSRFGDSYTTTLINRDGEAVKVKWQEGETVPVPGFNGFSVVGVSAKNVSLVHPPFDSCVASEQSGVSCGEGNVAVLSMATALPLPSNGMPPPEFVQGQNQPVFVNANGMVGMDPAALHDAQAQQVFVNPFNGQAEVVTQPSPEEQAARAEYQQRRAGLLNQIEAVRIDPAEVPPGMRLVRTPFGDRIVPARE